MVEIQDKIWYEGKEYYFIDEFDSVTEINQEIIWYQMQNIRVHCLQKNKKPQLYTSG
uniref:Uncharacterized protein n=1 Tax=Promethearchaeum syntrophicum TaxID=2594042 RepID=A0A5B9DFI2_9ARCH|nr:hypothetical protein [Candidatus Prometheoarchaeum syntrophicum]QEE17781.1 hypothetical protein DSAG12_03619 [Candidatus Prometheoarchaeum syntrophicum]